MAITEDQKNRFIEILKNTGNVSLASEEAGITRHIGYQLVRVNNLFEFFVDQQKLSEEERHLFFEAYKILKDVRDAAAAAKINLKTGYTLLKEQEPQSAKGRKPYPTKNPIILLLREITNIKRIDYIASVLGISYKKFQMLVYFTERLSQQNCQACILKLREQFPDKSEAIDKLELLICFERLHVRQIIRKAKNKTKKADIEASSRQEAGKILRDWREECGMSFTEAQQQITTPVVSKTLSRIEAGDPMLALSIYKDAVRLLPDIYTPRDKVLALAYIPRLQRLAKTL